MEELIFDLASCYKQSGLRVVIIIGVNIVFVLELSGVSVQYLFLLSDTT